MKKILGIIVLSLLLSGSAYSWEWTESAFNEWLKNSGSNKRMGCENPPRLIYCYDENNNPLWKKKENNLKVKVYGRSLNIPEYINKKKVKPNYETLMFYLYRYNNGPPKTRPYYEIKASKSFFQFKFDLREDEYIKKQMQKTALLSYLLYENGKIKIDEITPKDRFGMLFNNDTKYVSNSVGKSFVSYILGHAICGGYIESVDSKLNDWPLLENTLYYDQKIIDLINMNAGDYEYFDKGGNFKKSRKHPSDYSVSDVIGSDLISSKKSKPKYKYNNFTTNIIHNYIVFKTKDNYAEILNNIFNDKAKIKNSIYLFEKKRGQDDVKSHKSKSYTFYVSRYDYLRVAKAMMDDWQNDTCEGKYLKSLYERKIKKNKKDYRDKHEAFSNTKSYGGFFHLDPSGMKNRHIFVMDGYGGQTLTIDFDRKRIVTTMAVHRNFNWKKIAHSVIKKGE